jgi:hypothetical protein
MTNKMHSDTENNQKAEISRQKNYNPKDYKIPIEEWEDVERSVNEVLKKNRCKVDQKALFEDVILL